MLFYRRVLASPRYDSWANSTSIGTRWPDLALKLWPMAEFLAWCCNLVGSLTPEIPIDIMYTAWCIFILTFTTEFCSNSHDFHTETAEETATEPLGAKHLGRWQSKMHPNQLHLYPAINIRSSNLYSLIYIFNKIKASFFGEIHPIVFGTSLSGLSWEPWGSVVASVAWVGVEKPLRDHSK